MKNIFHLEDEVIANFMDFQKIRIGYYGDTSSKWKQTEWQLKNSKWLNKSKIVKQYDNSIGDYYVNVEKDIIIPIEDVNYHSWNDLMPVVERIESLGFKFQICRRRVNLIKDGIGLEIVEVKEETKIKSVYKAVVEFIKYHNTQIK